MNDNGIPTIHDRLDGTLIVSFQNGRLRAGLLDGMPLTVSTQHTLSVLYNTTCTSKDFLDVLTKTFPTTLIIEIDDGDMFIANDGYENEIPDKGA